MKRYLLLAALLFALRAQAQLWSGIIDPTRAVDWSGAGATITNRTSNCSTQPTLLAGSGNATANSTAINNAFSADTGGNCVINLPAGTYYLGQCLFLSEVAPNFTVRGAGANQTTLLFVASPTSCGQYLWDVTNGDGNFSAGPDNVSSWTAGYSQGTTSITLNSVTTGAITNLKNGGLLILDQLDDSSDTGNIFATSLTGASTPFSQQGGSGQGRPGTTACSSGCRSQMQQVKVVSCVGANSATCTSGSATAPYTVVITPGLYSPNWRSGQSPGAWWGTSLPVSGLGIENFTIDASALSSSFGAIVGMNNGYGNWIKGMRFVNGTAPNAAHKHVWLYQTSHVTVRDSYFYGSNGTSESYGVDSSYGSSDNRIENNIFQHIASGLIRESETGSVYDYNYCTDNYYTVSASQMQADSYHHGPSDYMGLWEGNECVGMFQDDIHGSAWMLTAFRNWYNGKDPNSTSGTKTTDTLPIQAFAYARYENVIGNVLGTPSYHTTYQTFPSSTTDCGTGTNVSIYVVGYSGSGGFRFAPLATCPSGPGAAFAMLDDTFAPTAMMRWGNYDVVTAAVRWCGNSSNPGWVSICGSISEVPTGLSIYSNAVPSSLTLPASFTLSSQPSWWNTPWGTPPWPAIGPDVTGGSGPGGFAYNIPTELCYANTPIDSTYGSNNVLLFNSGTCYAAQGNSGTSGSGGGQVGYGFLPYPVARQDLALQLESPLPIAINSDGAGLNFPAGSTFVDPDFGETVRRVTDNNSIQGVSCFNSTAQNTLLKAADNPDLSNFSSDGTAFYVVDTNSNYWLYSFNPTTGVATCAPTSSTLHNLPWHPAFLHHTAGQMIGQTAVSAATPWIIQTANTSAPTTVTTAVDFSGATTPNCGAGNASWLTSVPQPNKSIGASPGLWLSNDDSVYEMSIGNSQNQFWLSMFYNTVNHECAWVDTRTGQVGGNLVTTGTLSGAFPLDWGSPRAPTAPTVTQTTGGSLTSGHTYDVCYSLAELTRESGTGETSCSTIQRITLSGGNTALTIPSPAQCSNGQNCDIEMWNYYNVYANDEANCSNAQCPASSMWIQPAANLGCALAAPTFTSGNIVPHVTGSTNYAYAEVVWNGSCGTFTQASISNGASTVDSSHFNTITGATVSGGQLYMIVSGGIGNSSVWPSTVYGSSTVDAAQPGGGGTPMFPGQISDGGGSAPSPVDNGSLGINLFAMATIPLCSGVNPSSGLLSGSCSLAGNNIYSATNNTTLTAVSTSTGITAPTKTTLGLFQHAAIMNRSGGWMQWGQESVFTSNVVWNLGTLTDTMCNVNKANEYPTTGSYFNCPGHGLEGLTHETLDVGPSNVMSPGVGSDPNFSTLCIALDGSFPVHSNGLTLTSNCGTNTAYSFPAADPNDAGHTMAWDTHETWAPSAGYGSDTNTEYQQSWDASGGTNTAQYPTYIGRGWEREIIGKQPNATVSRYAHTRTSSYPYYTLTPCVSLPLPCFNGASLNYDSYSTESQDGHWVLWVSDMNSSLGCIPTEVFPITGFTAPNQITISANNSNTAQAPLTNQIGTVLDTTGVTGLNGQWTASSVTGSNPYTVTLTGASLSGTVSGGTWQNCTFNTAGQVNGPVPASTCGSGAQACQTGQARVDVWLAQKK